MIRRLSLTASSLLISAWKPRAMVSSTSSTGAPSGYSNSRSGNWIWQVAITAEQNSVCLSVKWLYTVSFETPAAAATASMLVLA
ncbi:hypothetical protein D3C85_1685710 [compost metagenome]